MTEFLKWVLRAVLTAGWAPVVYFAVHIACYFGGAYVRVDGLDIPMHIGGGLVIAWFFARAADLPEAVPVLGTQPALGRSLFAWAALCAAVVFWEFAEWSTDALGLTRCQKGLDDTMKDMALGVAGGTLLLLGRWSVVRRAAAP